MRFRPLTVLLVLALFVSAGSFVYMQRSGALKYPQNDAMGFAWAQLNACEEAAQLLGTPIEKTSGISPLNPDIAVNGRRSTRFIVKVRGSKASGQYESDAQMRNGLWQLTLGRLEAGGKAVDIIACLEKKKR